MTNEKVWHKLDEFPLQNRKQKKSTRMQKQCVPQVSFPLASAEK